MNTGRNRLLQVRLQRNRLEPKPVYDLSESYLFKANMIESLTLVGVAIAVALVPPLATIGLRLEEGHWDLAAGAYTLFATNFVGITLAATATLLITRYAPLPKLRPASTGLAVGLGITVLAIVVLMLPLGNTYLQVVRSPKTATTLHQQVVDTLDPSLPVVVKHIDVTSNQIIIDLSDVNGASSATQFEADLVDELGQDVKVELRLGST